MLEIIISPYKQKIWYKKLIKKHNKEMLKLIIFPYQQKIQNKEQIKKNVMKKC